MWRNFRFQCMTDVEKFEISPHAEEFRLFPHNRCRQMWNFAKFGGGVLHISTWQMWRNPKLTLFCCCKICFCDELCCFCEICFGAIHALLRGEKLSQKLDRWRRNDKYEVWFGWFLMVLVVFFVVFGSLFSTALRWLLLAGWALLGTSGYFELLKGTWRYFWVLSGTSGYFEALPVTT